MFNKTRTKTMTGSGPLVPAGARPLPHCLQSGGGETGRLIRAHNWNKAALGPPAQWPQNLQETTGLILHSAFPMFLWWGHDLVNIYNDASAKVFGNKHPGALGKPAREVWPDIWPVIGPLVERVFNDGSPIYCKDLQLFSDRNGYTEEIYCTFSYSPVFSADGGIDGLLCTFSETTEEVHQRQKLISLNTAKDEFISLASHQLRTPATGVKQYLGMLLDNFAGDLTPIQRELAQHAYDSNERQLAVVSDLLSTAQADSGLIDLHKKPVDIVQLINDVIEEQASKFSERKQKVTFSYGQEACLASIDQDRMRMVLDNLVDNASKYTHAGDNKKIFLSLERTDNNEIIIRIQDQGVGISKSSIDTIFDKFIRVQNPLSKSVGGNGLGLYLARKIVELHNGHLDVTSTLGKGSTFTIVLPA